MCGNFHGDEDLCSTDVALGWSLSTALSFREGSGGSTSLSLRQLLNKRNLAFSIYSNALSLNALLLAAASNSPSCFALRQLLYTNALCLAWARAPARQARPPPQGCFAITSCLTISSRQEIKLILGSGQWGLERGAPTRQLPRLRPRYHM